MTLPLVSCLMPTYGRYPDYGNLVNEAVYWFLRQDYVGPKELVILNDAPHQTLVCTLPGVRVVNATTRHRTLGGKYNAMLDLARGSVVLPWEDDDVSLPGRISQAVQALGDFDYWNPHGVWWEQHGALRHENVVGYWHNASAYRHGRLRYPETCRGQDAEADAFAHRHLRVAPDSLADQPWRWTYVYRWGHSSMHLSAAADPQAFWDKGIPGGTGTFTIAPGWTRDYVADTSAYLQTLYRAIGQPRTNPCHAN